MIGIGLGVGALQRTKRVGQTYPSSFFNGMDFRLASPAYIGGPTYVPDHLGVLRSPGSNRWAVQGMRLATTLADGAVLGAEVWPTTGAFNFESATVTADANLIYYTESPTNVSAYKFLTGIVTKTNYRCKFEIVSIDKGALYFDPGASATTVFATAGVHEVDLLWGANTWAAIRTVGVTTATVRIISLSARQVIPTYLNTDESGNAIVPSTPQKTVTYNTDWTAKTFAETFDKFDISDPLKAPGWLCEPVRTNYALNSATPATHTTGTLAVGTYTLWQEGTGSIVATAGTAVGTFGTASNGAPATITITTAGTVVLTASGTNTWVQLELGAFKTSRIYTTTAPVTRAATIASFPTAGKIPVNDFAIRMIVVPMATGQSGAHCFGSYVDSSNYTVIYIQPGSIILRKRVSGVDTDATASITHAIGVPLDFILYSSPMSGMQISIRSFSSSWGSFTDGSANSATAAKANAPIAATYQLGALAGSNQFTGNISSAFECVPIPSGITDPMAWAKTHWGMS